MVASNCNFFRNLHREKDAKPTGEFINCMMKTSQQIPPVEVVSSENSSLWRLQGHDHLHGFQFLGQPLQVPGVVRSHESHHE